MEPGGAARSSPPLVGAAVVLSSLLTVAPLLAWVFRLGAFRTWFVAVTLPATLFVVAAAVVARSGRRPLARLDVAISAGVLGGAVGTVGYDLFRVPFTLIGMRVLAPIDSYGVLLTGATASGPGTGIAGWGYHFANGILFGVAYAVVARGRHWSWAVGWAMVLESATIVTPFFGVYALRGQTQAIVVAYAAHVAYGVPLGMIVQAAGRWRSGRDAPIRPTAVVGILAVALLAWHRPWSTPSGVAAARRIEPGPAAVIRGGRFLPEWLRVPAGGCATIRNGDTTAASIAPAGRSASAPLVIAPHATGRLCSDALGIHRVKVGSRPFSGGFLLVDPALTAASLSQAYGLEGVHTFSYCTRWNSSVPSWSR